MRMMDRVQEDLGGPDELAKLFSGLGFPMPGPDGATGTGEIPGFGTPPPSPSAASDSWDDRPRPPAPDAKPDGPSDPSPKPDGDDPSPAGT